MPRLRTSPTISVYFRRLVSVIRVFSATCERAIGAEWICRKCYCTYVCVCVYTPVACRATCLIFFPRLIRSDTSHIISSSNVHTRRPGANPAFPFRRAVARARIGRAKFFTRAHCDHSFFRPFVYTFPLKIVR